jgi:lipoprotein-anchoring transpeptidase ErfK/SrfK
MVRLAAAAVAVLVLSWSMTSTAGADVVVHINKSSQNMSVSIDGERRYSWAISTGRGRYGTPSGSYRPQMLARRWFSRKYYNSPMPYSIFFHGGYAIHGTYYISQLGGPASHGCVRLHPSNAAILFSLVQKEGMGRTRITIQ